MTQHEIALEMARKAICENCYKKYNLTNINKNFCFNKCRYRNCDYFIEKAKKEMENANNQKN